MEKLNKIIQPVFLIALLVSLLLLLKDFLIPFSYALLIALIVYPICIKLEKNKVPRSLAIYISVFLVVAVLSLMVIVFVMQVQSVNKELPDLLGKLNQLFIDAQNWIELNLGITINQQQILITDSGKNLPSILGKIITGSIGIAAESLINIIIIPLFAILILYYRNSLVNFVNSLFGEEYRQSLTVILSEAIHMYYKYVKGMFWVYIIVGILNSIGLLLLGVNHAILFGLISALMTIIPYAGIIISSILPITLVWMETGNILYPLGVIGVFSLVQYLEANLIFPYIVGKQLGVNMLISIVSIFLGGVLWGVSGMILFLPFVALIKIISSHIEPLKPISKLLEIPKK